MRSLKVRYFVAAAVAMAVVAAGAVGWAADGGGASDPADVAKEAAAQRTPGNAKDFTAINTAARFAPGVTYAEALRAIFMAEQTGETPLEFEIVPAPAGGAVLVSPASADEGITVWLGAPWGYSTAWGPNSAALTPTNGGAPTGAGVSEAGPWPAETILGVPVLPACQVSDRAERAPLKRACSDSDIPLFDTDLSPAIPLP